MTGYEPQIARQDWQRATADDWASVLAGVSLFSKVGKRRLRKLAEQAEIKEFATGEHVIVTGEPADSFYVILGGEARAFSKPAARTLRTGDYFGELALLDNGRRSASVVATRDLHVMRVPRRAFAELVDDHADIALKIARELGARVRRLEHTPA
jgi:CRP/FNR family transcriptional regulator, cyclic AMP receptor protein